MRRYKKALTFMLVLAVLLGAQAVGFGFKYLQSQISAGEVSKSHPAVNLESIETENINPDYINVDKSTLKQNSSQVIKVGLGTELSNVSKVSLKYQLEGSDEVSVQDTSNIENGYITFAYSVGDKTKLGKYNLQSIDLKAKDGSLLNNVNLEQLAASYTVVPDQAQAAAAEDNGAAVASANNSDTSAVVGVDENNAITGADIGAAIENAKKAMKDETGIGSAQTGTDENEVSAASSGVTIVLDPGHGGTESGAVANGYTEKTLNLKIAQYAKAELETYNGVTVGMTRTDDSVVGLEQRAINAQQQGAAILVSLHNNASGYGTSYGSEVYVSVLKAYHDSSAVLGNLILDQLSALGLYDRGVKVRASESGTIFTLTGELADYYAVIKYSAYRGFPGIIVEHCFMDNATDAQKYLSSDAKLKELGVADAKALAEYYGLQKKGASTSTTVNLASKKTTTASAAFNNLTFATDGIKTADNYADSSAATGRQYVQVDLGDSYNLGSINLWHYFGDSRKYKDVVVQLSNDPTFASGVTTVYNNDTDNSAGFGKGIDSEYAETSAGKIITFGAVNARYARFYSNGSSVNGYSHYGEIEIYKADTASLIHPQSVSMNKTTLELSAGRTDTLTAGVLPANSTDKRVTWSSSTPTVATVSASGLVTGVSEGAAKITATTIDGSIAASCNVTVLYSAYKNLSKGILPTSSSSVYKNLGLATDGIKTVDNYSDSYTGTGLQYVQVDLGTSYNIDDIKLWHYFGDSRTYRDVLVQLSNDPAFVTGVTTVYNNDADNSAGCGKGTDSEYTETSLGKSIKFDAVKARYARFYSSGSTVNGYSHYGEIEIYEADPAKVIHPKSVTMSQMTAAMEAGVKVQLTASVLPANASDKSVAWSSSDTSVATVSAGGLITAVKAGTATITAKTVDGNITATCVVTVKSAAIVSNLAAGKVPSASSSTFLRTSYLTDGDKDTNDYADSYPGSGLQWVQIDLGASYDMNNIKLWHYFGDARKYHDVIVQLSNDSSFSTGVITTVFNNDTDDSAGLGLGKDSEYTETSSGLNIAFNSVNARYARFYSSGSNVNNWNHYVEIEVYNSKNLAVNLLPNTLATYTNMKYATDGDKNTENYVDMQSGIQYAQVDLGVSHNLNSIKLWHYFGDSRKYHDVIVQLSNDPTFASGVTTVYNNDTDNSAGRGAGTDLEYTETISGKDIPVGSVNARYVRLYSNGSTVNAWNHYVEVEVY
jgi:uncharacterized protein YjdB/N-acetylmuramoyl-L-alanine amidase